MLHCVNLTERGHTEEMRCGLPGQVEKDGRTLSGTEATGRGQINNVSSDWKIIYAISSSDPHLLLNLLFFLVMFH